MQNIRDRWREAKVAAAASLAALKERIEECVRDVRTDCGQEITKSALTGLVQYSCYSAPSIHIDYYTYLPTPTTAFNCRLSELQAWIEAADSLTGDVLRLKADELLIAAEESR